MIREKDTYEAQQQKGESELYDMDIKYNLDIQLCNFDHKRKHSHQCLEIKKEILKYADSCEVKGHKNSVVFHAVKSYPVFDEDSISFAENDLENFCFTSMNIVI